MKISLHNEGICKYGDWGPIFFFIIKYILLTIYGPQQFAKIKIVKVDYFDSTVEIFETLV